MTKKIHTVGRLSLLGEGTQAIVEVEGREIGLFNVAGEVHAVPNICFHQNGPLCRGVFSGTLVATEETGWKAEWAHDGEIIRCPWHALEFNVTTGECLSFPRRRLRRNPVEIVDDEIRVTL